MRFIIDLPRLRAFDLVPVCTGHAQRRHTAFSVCPGPVQDWAAGTLGEGSTMTSPVTVSERDLRTDRFLFVRGVKSLGKAAASPPLFFLGAVQVTGSFLRSQGCCASRLRTTVCSLPPSPTP